MNPIKRREFLKKSSACCMVIAGASSFAFSADEKPSPKELNYCGYKCPDDCKMYVAGKSDDESLKKEAFKLWRFEEKYKVEYSPEIVFCEKCKGTESPKSLVLTKCTIRKCAIEKGYDCCIECDELKGCVKEIWTTFPEFHKKVQEMQAIYKA